MREACKFNVRIHNGNIVMSSVTKEPGVSSILLFSGSGINFPRPLQYTKKIYRLKEDQAFSLSLELGQREKVVRHPSADFHPSAPQGELPPTCPPIFLGGGSKDCVDTIINSVLDYYLHYTGLLQ